MYIKHNTEVHSCNHCCRGKAISITFAECLSVALVIQHAKHMCHIILSSVAFAALSYSSTSSHKWHIFKTEKLNVKCVFFSKTFFWKISHFQKNSARRYHKCTYVFIQSTHYSCQISMTHYFPQHIFEKHSNVRFHENPFSESQDVPHGHRHDEANSHLLQFCECS